MNLKIARFANLLLAGCLRATSSRHGLLRFRLRLIAKRKRLMA